MEMGLARLLGEVRVVGEFVAFAGDALVNGSSVSAQGEKAVLLIPGFMAGDMTLYPIAGRLRASGYQTFFAGIWVNADCPISTLGRLERSLRVAARATGAKVAVVGHSLGGIYARELARRFPDLVERIVMLGSPIRHPVENSNRPIRLLASAVSLAHRRCITSLGARCEICGFDVPRTPPPVPETIIYSKSDGVVRWEACIESGPEIEAVEVSSSHCGMAMSLEVWKIITSRLDGSAHSAERIHKPAAHPVGVRRRIQRLMPSYLKLVKPSAA
ncbi:MAG: alpha/beta hydrolase [Candidatus Binataceae bacterium]